MAFEAQKFPLLKAEYLGVAYSLSFCSLENIVPGPATSMASSYTWIQVVALFRVFPRRSNVIQQELSFRI